MSTCTLTVSEDKKYIVMKVVGDVNSVDMIQHNLEAHKLARSLNLKSFLLDMTEATNVNKVFENYDFVYNTVSKSRELIPHVRVAMVIRHGDHSHDFIETLANNAGNHLETFHDIQEAVRFLTQQGG